MIDSRLAQMRRLLADADEIAAGLQDELKPHSYSAIALGALRRAITQAIGWIDRVEMS